MLRAGSYVSSGENGSLVSLRAKDRRLFRNSHPNCISSQKPLDERTRGVRHKETLLCPRIEEKKSINMTHNRHAGSDVRCVVESLSEVCAALSSLDCAQPLTIQADLVSQSDLSEETAIMINRCIESIASLACPARLVIRSGPFYSRPWFEALRSGSCNPTVLLLDLSYKQQFSINDAHDLETLRAVLLRSGITLRLSKTTRSGWVGIVLHCSGYLKHYVPRPIKTSFPWYCFNRSPWEHFDLFHHSAEL
jgi:hypothetical protein